MILDYRAARDPFHWVERLERDRDAAPVVVLRDPDDEPLLPIGVELVSDFKTLRDTHHQVTRRKRQRSPKVVVDGDALVNAGDVEDTLDMRAFGDDERGRSPTRTLRQEYMDACGGDKGERCQVHNQRSVAVARDEDSPELVYGLLIELPGESDFDATVHACGSDGKLYSQHRDPPPSHARGVVQLIR